MRPVALALDSKRQPWTLGIEPWGESVDVPAGASVRVEIQFSADANIYQIGISHGADGLTVGIDAPRFSIEVGNDKRDFDFS
jgi:hypothetical protein